MTHIDGARGNLRDRMAERAEFISKQGNIEDARLLSFGADEIRLLESLLSDRTDEVHEMRTKLDALPPVVCLHGLRECPYCLPAKVPVEPTKPCASCEKQTAAQQPTSQWCESCAISAEEEGDMEAMESLVRHMRATIDRRRRHAVESPDEGTVMHRRAVVHNAIRRLVGNWL